MSAIRVYVHVVWAVKFRRALLLPDEVPVLRDFIHTALTARGHEPLITNAEPDHLHTLFRFSCREDIGATMNDVKGNSSRELNKERRASGLPDFKWQGGYGAFSVSYSGLDGVKVYIRDQQRIHATRRGTFLEEYDELIRLTTWMDERPHYFEPLT